MTSKKIFIINFFPEKILNDYLSNLNTKILSICSIYIHLLINKNIFVHISIIFLNDGFIHQLSHLSGNKFHQYQGLCRIKPKNSHIKNNLKSAFLLAIKLLNKNSNKSDNEIILFNYGIQNLSFFNTVIGKMFKNKIKLSSILFNERNYFLETLTKITGGDFILINLKNKINLNSFLKFNTIKKIQHLYFSFLTFKSFQTKFFFIIEKKEIKKNLIIRLKTICSHCNFFLKSDFFYFCPNCLIFGGHNQFFIEKNKEKNKFLLYETVFDKKFSIFSIFLIEKKFLQVKKNSLNNFNSIGLNILFDFLFYPLFIFNKKKVVFSRNNNKEIFSRKMDFF
jgi:hypothetical protein